MFTLAVIMPLFYAFSCPYFIFPVEAYKTTQLSKRSNLGKRKAALPTSNKKRVSAKTPTPINTQHYFLNDSSLSGSFSFSSPSNDIIRSRNILVFSLFNSLISSGQIYPLSNHFSNIMRFWRSIGIFFMFYLLSLIFFPISDRKSL